MKKLTKILALVLALALLFSLAACGSSNPDGEREKRAYDRDETKTTEETAVTYPSELTEETAIPTELTEQIENDEIVGTWKYDMQMEKLLDAAQKMDEIPAEFNGMMDVLTVLYDGIVITLVMDLKEDKTCTVSAEEASLQEAAKVIEERLPAFLPDLLTVMTGMTREELEEQLAASGMTVDEFIAVAASQITADQLLASMTPPVRTGTYAYEEDKLTLTYEDGSKVVYTVELNGDELTVSAIEGSASEYPEGILPMVFVR